MQLATTGAQMLRWPTTYPPATSSPSEAVVREAGGLPPFHGLARAPAPTTRAWYSGVSPGALNRHRTNHGVVFRLPRGRRSIT